MTIMSPRTIEATYENGLLRPLEPIQELGNQVYLVTILDIDAFRAKPHPQRNRNLRANLWLLEQRRRVLARQAD